MKKISSLIEKIGVNNEVAQLTKSNRKAKHFTKIKDNIPLQQDLNFMADLLMLPEDSKGFRYCLVVTDLATNEFDIEPIKVKTPTAVLEAMKTIMKRKYLKQPEASIATDDGNEFKGSFENWLQEKDIFHKISLPGRHRQTSAVENLNRTLGYLFNSYMNQKEKDTGKTYRNWTDIVDTVRTELNALRDKPAQSILKEYPVIDLSKEPKFKVGDVVYFKSEAPLDALGKKQSTMNFRTGDFRYNVEKRKIIRVLFYAGKVPYRYLLEGVPEASFTENELIKASDATDSTYIIQQIIGKEKVKGKLYYKVWWKGYPKKQATLVEKATLVEDGAQEYIDEFENSSKDKKVTVKGKKN